VIGCIYIESYENNLVSMVVPATTLASTVSTPLARQPAGPMTVVLLVVVLAGRPAVAAPAAVPFALAAAATVSVAPAGVGGRWGGWTGFNRRQGLLRHTAGDSKSGGEYAVGLHALRGHHGLSMR